LHVRTCRRWTVVQHHCVLGLWQSPAMLSNQSYTHVIRTYPHLDQVVIEQAISSNRIITHSQAAIPSSICSYIASQIPSKPARTSPIFKAIRQIPHLRLGKSYNLDSFQTPLPLMAPTRHLPSASYSPVPHPTILTPSISTNPPSRPPLISPPPFISRLPPFPLSDLLPAFLPPRLGHGGCWAEAYAIDPVSVVCRICGIVSCDLGVGPDQI